MGHAIQYITDERGNRMSVIVSLRKWEDINSRYRKLRSKMDVMAGIKESLEEMKANKNLQTLKDFLNESKSK